MKLLLLLLTLTTITACNQERNRLSSCKDANGRSIQCASNALTVESFRKMYIAEVDVPVRIGVSNFLLNGTAKRADSDTEYNCELDVAAGTQFNYVLKNSKLTLTNGITSLVFNKTEGLESDDFLGTWTMVENSTKTQIVTELIFNDLTEVRMKKTCYLK